MTPSVSQCQRIFASKSRATRVNWDGRLFRGNAARGSFCRPICSVAMQAKAGEELFFASAAAAVAQGFMACAVCQPEYAPRCPDWALADRELVMAVRAIERRLGEADPLPQRLATDELAQRFAARFGATIEHYLSWQRAQLVKRLIDGTDWSLARIAQAGGIGSAVRVTRMVRNHFGAAPSELRKQGSRAKPQQPSQIRLPLREPFDAVWVSEFLTKRSLPGLEEVHDGVYRRRLPKSGSAAKAAAGEWLQVVCLLYTSPSPRDKRQSRMPSSA